MLSINVFNEIGGFFLVFSFIFSGVIFSLLSIFNNPKLILESRFFFGFFHP